MAVTLNDDAPETLTVNFGQGTYTATEGAAVDVTVTLNLDPERTVTIPINHTPQGGATSCGLLGGAHQRDLQQRGHGEDLQLRGCLRQRG